MGQLLTLGSGPVGSHRDPKPSKPKKSTFLGKIFCVKAHGQNDLEVTIDTDAGQKILLLSHSKLPGKNESIAIGQRFEFVCRPNISTRNTSSAKWRALEKPADPLSEYDYCPFNR